MSSFSKEEIAEAAQWTGNPDDFIAALTSTGWIYGNSKLHAWSKYGGKYVVTCKKNRFRKRRFDMKQKLKRSTENGNAYVTVTERVSNALEKNRIEKNINTYAQTVDFERFWKAYPRKVAKGDAEKAFRSLNPDSDLVERMLSAVQIQKAAPDWVKDGGKFVPYPGTWLRARRWEDEMEAPDDGGITED